MSPSPATDRLSTLLAALEAARVPTLPPYGELKDMACDPRPIDELVELWKADPRNQVIVNAYRAIEQRARRTASFMIKCRARDYRKRPASLNIIMPNLASANGDRLIAWGEHFLEVERSELRRWWGFGAEVSALNARALILLGRYRRRFEDHEQVRAA